jgi:integrase
MSGFAEGDGGAILFDQQGRRKYLTRSERARFLSVALRAEEPIAAFGQLLAYTGCRISEGLALTPERLDADTCRVVFRTLKRRRSIFRAVPIPASLMADLVALSVGKAPGERIWTWCRQTAWRHVKRLMLACGVKGTQAMPKGLRHSFGIGCAEYNVPAALTKSWMGHARLETTAIYQAAVGEEERAFAERMWAQPIAAPTKRPKR